MVSAEQTQRRHMYSRIVNFPNASDPNDDNFEGNGCAVGFVANKGLGYDSSELAGRRQIAHVTLCEPQRVAFGFYVAEFAVVFAEHSAVRHEDQRCVELKCRQAIAVRCKIENLFKY